MAEKVLCLRVCGAMFYAFAMGFFAAYLSEQPPWHMVTLWLIFQSHWAPWVWALIGTATGPWLVEHKLRLWNLWPRKPLRP